jgi:hypothetical protein
MFSTIVIDETNNLVRHIDIIPDFTNNFFSGSTRTDEQQSYLDGSFIILTKPRHQFPVLKEIPDSASIQTQEEKGKNSIHKKNRPGKSSKSI